MKILKKYSLGHQNLLRQKSFFKHQFYLILGEYATFIQLEELSLDYW